MPLVEGVSARRPCTRCRAIAWIIAGVLALLLTGIASAQGEPVDGCTVEELTRQQQTVAQYLPLDFEKDRAQAIANLYRLGALYQSMALYCDYQPNTIEVTAMLERALEYASLEELIAAQSVGRDIDDIMAQLDETYGDPFAGQQLYNGEQPALGGVMLGCAGCHENEATAPLTAATWTRANEIRLAQPQFADYDERRYLVESIVEPTAYITPDYANVMPDIYATQLTAQNLADLVAFLDSQDQLLDG